MSLTTDERRSQTWVRLEELLLEELEKLRELNDDVAKDAIETAAIRGRIKQTKWVLGLGAEKKTPEPIHTPDFY